MRGAGSIVAVQILDTRRGHCENPHVQRPLEGIRSLDFTIWAQGTYGSAVVADLGADVLKMEEPQSGAPGRYFDVTKEIGLSSYFEAHNRGKRSIALNLKHARGREVCFRLAEQADVFLTNFRAAAIKRIGLMYEELSAANPRIVYAQAYGQGHYGDDAALRSF